MSARLSRRWVLRGVGAALGLPWLEALAQPAPPRRFVTVFSPNGTVASEWTPTRAATGWTLSPILAPLAPWQEKLLVPVNVDLKTTALGPGDGHQRGMVHLWTARPLRAGTLFGNVGWATGPSIDQVVAGALGTSTAMRSLELGVLATESNVLARMVYGPDGLPIAPENDPAAVFERLFGAADPLAAARRRARRQSVLDAVQGELRALSSRVSAADRHVLDAHATSVREVERRIAAVTAPSATCQRPAPPQVALGDPDSFARLGALQTDLLALALSCDVTRVASLQWSRSASPLVHRWAGVTVEHHELSHHTDDDPAARAAVTAVHRWYAARFAQLLERLDATPAGPGVTLLDQSVIVWGNELGQGNTHSHRAVPFVVAGGGGGALQSGLLDAAGASHAELLLACGQAAGASLSTFGEPGFCRGPLPGVLR